MNQGSLIIFSGILSLGLSGCLDHLGTAVRTTCLTDSDCADTDLGVRCLPLDEGDTILGLRNYEIWDTWEKDYNLAYSYPTPSTTIGMPKICDVDFDEDGVADVMVKDHFFLTSEVQDTTTERGECEQGDICGELRIKGLGAEGPCDAYPGLVIDNTPSEKRDTTSNRCLPPLVTR